MRNAMLIVIAVAVLLAGQVSAQWNIAELPEVHESVVSERTGFCQFASPASGGQFASTGSYGWDQAYNVCLRPAEGFGPMAFWLYIGYTEEDYYSPGLIYVETPDGQTMLSLINQRAAEDAHLIFLLPEDEEVTVWLVNRLDSMTIAVPR